jgi:alginate O-acetyltransferase complex protein AlgI
MLFTTSTFVVLFLPIVLFGFFTIGRWSPSWAAAWLLGASLFFYGYWMPEFTLLLVASIAVNFRVGQGIARALSVERFVAGVRTATWWMVAGIAFDLGLLAYFKYANFFVDNVNALLGTHWNIGNVLLPIGISFYTFTQIAFLVDTWYGKVNEYRPVHYGLFVTYFPHLIAGPVLHHAQMMPQFGNPAVYRLHAPHIFGGVVIFAIGLFKKVVLADGIAPYANAVFVPADAGELVTVREAWLGALAYTFQLYFDFSGYSDMAIGLSWMFNIRLPYNFNSPYKAANISDFWRRWHISLSTFLRDYLYIALGGNRKGPGRRYVNLGITMVLGGLWHGASWSFVLWGALHGAYLVVNHAFRSLIERLVWHRRLDTSLVYRAFAWGVTITAVVAAWVFFRAQTMHGALAIVSAMVGSGSDEVTDVLIRNAGLKMATGFTWCAVLALAVVALPNSNWIGERVLSAFEVHRGWTISAGASALTIALFLVLVNTARDSVSAFIYFNF